MPVATLGTEISSCKLGKRAVKFHQNEKHVPAMKTGLWLHWGLRLLFILIAPKVSLSILEKQVCFFIFIN